MKILIVGQCYYPDNFRINDISRELVKEGHEVTVLTGLPDYATGRIPKEFRRMKKRRETVDGVQIVRVPIFARRTGLFWRVLNYGSFFITSTLYAAFCREKTFDLVFCYQTSPILMANAAVKMKKRAGCPLFLYCLDLWPESLKVWNVKEKSLLFRLVHRYSIRMYNQCDQIGISSSPFQSYLEEIDRVNPSRIVYLPQHAETLTIRSGPSYQQKKRVDFAFCGNIGSVQDVECIVRAAHRLRDLTNFQIHIYGDGSNFDACKALSKECQVEQLVCFHGRVSRKELLHEYETIDAFLLTLKAEGFVGMTMPAKLQEYMSVGRPVFVAANGAAAEVVRDAHCGFLASASDDETLAANMRLFLSDPERFAAYGKNARRYFERYFTKERYMARLNEIFNQLRKGR